MAHFEREEVTGALLDVQRVPSHKFVVARLDLERDKVLDLKHHIQMNPATADARRLSRTWPEHRVVMMMDIHVAQQLTRHVVWDSRHWKRKN